MMATLGPSAVVQRKQTVTPKAIIHMKFGTAAIYDVEEVQDPTNKACPGLAISNKGPCLFRCHLQLPGFSVMSEVCKKKKDAEQSAAQMAIAKLDIHPSESCPTADDSWNNIIAHITYLFSNEFLSSVHPLSGHFRAALRRDGDLYGSVPVTAIALLDTKLTSRCKIIDPKVELKPFLVIPYIMKAVASLPESVVAGGDLLSVRRKNPYPSDIIEAVANQFSDPPDSISILAIHIPCLLEKGVEPVTINISSKGYYADIIAETLNLTDGNKVMMSRTIGKASHETRLYFPSPKINSLIMSSEIIDAEEAVRFEGSLNARASYICGQDIYGDAILASIGYKWNSGDLYHEDVTQQSYYRILLSKTPGGVYKLSREATLTADLPSVFSTRSNWRGSYPRDILVAFCNKHQLAAPFFPTFTPPQKSSSKPTRSPKKLKVAESSEEEAKCANEGGMVSGKQDSSTTGDTYGCEVKLFSKSQQLIIECSPKKFYKKQNDAIQTACLKILSWMNAYFEDPNMPLEMLTKSADALDIQFNPQNFYTAFGLCKSLHTQHNVSEVGESLKSSCMSLSQMSGTDSGVCLSNGSLLCVCYSVSLVRRSENLKELLESNEEFEFEVGSGAVIPQLETVATQLSVGQSACFSTDCPTKELILAAVNDSTKIHAALSSGNCCLEYSVILLQLTGPPEERMEQALFSPPLSKQRVEYAVKHIKESCATSLVDFGCGSGSLLDSLLDYPIALETVAGVDISPKGLIRAAKMLHSKLNVKSCPSIKSVVLYDGSITDYDSRLEGFDIGTCLEVIEHMEEDQACLFGDIALSSFRPKILIVSTPNYEYNVILKGSMLISQEDDPDEKSQSKSCRFRNHDHKFEWTRQQFNHWATELAERHNYSVEFSGVGGSGNVEPGFASQIAVFRRQDQDFTTDADIVHPYNVIWDLNSYSDE